MIVARATQAQSLSNRSCILLCWRNFPILCFSVRRRCLQVRLARDPCRVLDRDNDANKHDMAFAPTQFVPTTVTKIRPSK